MNAERDYTEVNVAFRLACGCLWRLGRGGPIPAREPLHVGSERDCWNGHGTQRVTEVRIVEAQP